MAEYSTRVENRKSNQGIGMARVACAAIQNDRSIGLEIVVGENDYGTVDNLIGNLENGAIIAQTSEHTAIIGDNNEIKARVNNASKNLMQSEMSEESIQESKATVKQFMETHGYKTLAEVIDSNTAKENRNKAKGNNER